jgi:hypothetical protein
MAVGCAARVNRAINDVAYAIRGGRCVKGDARHLENALVYCERQVSRGLRARGERTLEEYQEKCGAYLSGARRKRRS